MVKHHSKNVKARLFDEMEAVADGETEFTFHKQDFPSWHGRQCVWLRPETKKRLKFYVEHSKNLFRIYDEVIFHLVNLALKEENLVYLTEEEQKAKREAQEARRWMD